MDASSAADSAALFPCFFLFPLGIWGGMILIQAVFWTVWLFFVVVWILFLIDAVKRDEKQYSTKDEKLIWILILIFTGWVGSLLYYLLVYKKYGKAH